MRVENKALDLPYIPLLNPETESVDLAQVGPQGLDTHLDAPGAGIGEFIHIQLRGRTRIGIPHDLVDRVPITKLDDQNRVIFAIPKPLLDQLDGGHVFFSYALDGPGGQPLDESLRLDFRVNRPVLAGGLSLGIAQVRQSHDLQISIEALDFLPLSVVTPPFQAMVEGAEVTLSWLGYFGEGVPYPPYEQSYPVTAQDIGQPLVWSIPWDQVAIFIDGFAELKYSIRHDNGQVTVSALQRFDIKETWPTVRPLLPAPRIKGLTGGALDPDQYPDGIEVIMPYDPAADLQSGDQLVLYIEGSARVVYTARVDPTTLDSHYMAVFDSRWVHDKENFGKPFSISYQYARKGMALHSEPLQLTVRRRLLLPMPIVEEAYDGEENNEGVAYPIDLTAGARVRIPQDAVIEDGQVLLIWEGHETVELEPSIADPRLFRVPPAVIAANLGKQVCLYYSVTPPGEWSQPSDPFYLNIADIAVGSYQPVQNTQLRNGKLSFKEVTHPDGTLFTLRKWPFFAREQPFRMVAIYEGLPEPLSLRKSDVITLPEYNAGLVEGWLPKSFLQQMRDRKLELFDVLPSVSFDGGHTFKAMRPLRATLID
ncbi:hypothetical protein [Pseudomonas putida]|uniref:hypothetical protein n=1 Tax=Pseudomonas putida TaxID=303 RepID=UPI0018D8D0A2|nr:hypothetical protein [Pseudomonas putida]MBH3411725.1 hypothetical protein [Pseudomonas putida]